MLATIVVVEEPPEIEITLSNKVQCNSLECGWFDYADDEGYAIELRRQHREWHEDGCPSLMSD